MPQGQEVKQFLEILDSQIRNRFHEYEKNPLYSECAILDPRFKKRAFRTQESFNKACDSLKRRIREMRLPDESVAVNKIVDDQPATSVTSLTGKKKSVWDSYDKDTNIILRPENPTAAGIREFDKYLNEEYIHRMEDPLQWWTSRKFIYPHLYRYMLKRLCIQATSVACERVFSNAGQILNQRRTLLKPDKVSQLIFLHANL
ncbi:unnamed protein product [Arctia plantaginis]|uniref:HAT C-terminal dimerisation domain-containing protein n=1 Tax=Arctia plantaginis TaxID=874455 RepID=A0A8S1A144_ARCPL|nr:unnamed protein product [Arctia plantaginis]